MILKRLIHMGLSLAFMAGLAYFFVTQLQGRQLEIEVTEQQVQQVVASGFPKTKRLMQLTELRLENPRIKLDDQQNRLHARLETRLQLQGIPIPVKGHIIASGKLDYHPQENTFFLKEIEVQRIDVKGLPDSVENRLRDGMTLFTREALGAVPVYQLQEKDLSERAAKMVLKKVRVEQGKMVLTMGVGG